MRRAAAVLVLALVATAACGGGDDEPDDGAERTSTTATSTVRSSVVPTLPSPPPTAADDGNYLANPSFEDVESPWIALEQPEWQRVTDVAHSGTASAKLPFDVPGPSEHSISYLVQEVTAGPFPEKVSGWYRVDNWVRGTPLQYLQFVVIVFGASNAPDLEGWPADTEINHQIRYPLAGIDTEPFPIDKAKFLFVTRDAEPAVGEWVSFERPLADDFAEKWGEVPEGYARIRLLLEVRVDFKTEDTPASGDVYFDDIFMGRDG